MKLFEYKKMPLAGGKKLFFPIFSILALALTLLILLGISTYRHLHEYQFRMEESLERDGKIILKSVDTYFRNGMMGMMGSNENLQEIMISIASLSDIRFVALVDQQGIIIADSDKHLVGTSFPEKEKIIKLSRKAGSASWFLDQGVFVVARKMEPFPAAGPAGSFPGYMMFRMHRLMSPDGSILDQVLSGRIYAVVGLDTKSFEEARSSDLRHAVLMGLILLILGTACLYFIFLVQNYYVTQRALNSVTLYANHVVENMPDGLLSLDQAGEIVALNYRAREILSLTGNPADKERIKEQIRPVIEPVLTSLKKKTPVLEYEVDFPGKNEKQIPLALSAARLIGGTGEDAGAVIILRDLTEIKELQEKIKRSQRLASLGTLAAGMAHEIRNPLSSIKGFAQYFFKKNPAGSDGRKYSEVIIQEVERLDRVISNLLDFARPKEPLKTSVSLEDIVRHTVELIRDDARSKEVQVTTEIQERLPSLMADKDQITQVLLNIVLNALDALKDGGKLSIRAFSDERQKILAVEIEDTGPGMSDDELSKIFDPFYTTKKTGTGLGLAIAYRIIEKHGGSLTVKSEASAGTVFRIELSLNAGDPYE